MTTLLMRLCAPLQAWGTRSHFGHRDTGREPYKSGVIGLLCAALGRPREASLDDLFALRMGVRIDCEGSIRRDFQTAGMGLDGNPKIWKVSGGVNSNLMTSDRFYLADAKFLVGLEGDASLLENLQYALQNPVWFLFLGRKSFIPSERIWLHDGIRQDPIETVFAQYEWLGLENPPSKLRCVLEDPSGTIVQHDSVQSFKPRRFLPRRMRMEWVKNPSSSIVEEDI